jgi:YbgC/YbaW family acyl-CoA thioester hydrolase
MPQRYAGAIVTVDRSGAGARFGPAPSLHPVCIRDRVRWSDVDAAGIVCFGRFLRFFELAEAELFHRATLTHQTLAKVHGLHLVRRRIECDFHSPLTLDTEVVATCEIRSIGQSSLNLDFRLDRLLDGSHVADATYVLVAVDAETLEKKVIPDAIRRALGQAV